MADNDRFEVVKRTECKKCLYKNSNYCEPSEKIICLSKGKTIEEYEDMIAEIINKEIDVVLNGRGNVTIKTLAKAVVGRLFGEGE